MSVYLCVYVAVYLFVYVYVYMCVYLSVYLFVYLYVYLSVYLSNLLRLLLLSSGHALAAVWDRYRCSCGANYEGKSQTYFKNCDTLCPGDKKMVCGSSDYEQVYITQSKSEIHSWAN